KPTPAPPAFTRQQRERTRAPAAALPRLWNDPGTPMRERKRLIRLLITDVTLTRGQDTITAAVRFPGGRHHVLRLPVPAQRLAAPQDPQPDHRADQPCARQLHLRPDRRTAEHR